MKLVLKIAFMALLTGAAYEDCRTRRIPNRYIGALFALGAGALLLPGGGSWGGKLAGLCAVSVPMFLLTLVFPGAFGGGDIKLMAACGLYLGAPDIVAAFFLALCLGGIYGLWLILGRKKSGKEEIALGPFLAAGAGLFLLFPLFKG